MNGVDHDYVQANVNGELHAAHRPTLSPLDRGFLYGDAIYEVWRTYQNRVFAWELHWQRLGASAAALHMEVPWSPQYLWSEIRRTCASFREVSGYESDLYIRLQISRGSGPIGLDITLADTPHYVILVRPVPRLSAKAGEQGLNLAIARTIRRNAMGTLDPAWKTGNYLNNILGLREAREAGGDDVIFLNLADELAEASTSNIGFIVGDRFVTPPLSAGILPGITRRLILEQVGLRAGLEVRERNLTCADLEGFEEAMLLSTTKDVQPVGRIDEHSFRVDGEARLWRLKRAFEGFAAESVKDRGDLSV